MYENIQPSIIFYIIDDNINCVKNFWIELDFLGNKKINLNEKLIIDEKYFPKSKDKFKTSIILNVDNKTYKFIITIYFDENHITIFKSSKIGVTYEIIQVFPNKSIIPLDKIDFIDVNNKLISAKHFDTINNVYKKRFMLVNFPINVKLNLNKIYKMKENGNYKINLFPNDIIIQEIKRNKKIQKEELIDLNEWNNIVKDIDALIEKNRKNTDLVKMKKIIDEIEKYDKYFNQNLMNKEEENWNLEEFTFYYYYFQFKLFIKYVCANNIRKISYYHSAMGIYKKIFNELEEMKNITPYEKICAIASLYNRLNSDCDNKENKNYIIGEYELINMENNKIKCYNLAYEFISKIINNLKENSFIFLPLLQVNSGFNKNINSDDEKEIFELSMTNENMVKRHLRLLLPKLLFTIRHPNISLKRGSICKTTGNIFIYETSIFYNNIGKEIDDIINDQPEDAAVAISFVILHEIFMHKKIRSNDDFVPGKETPSKFIGPQYEIKNFYYSNNKKNLDPLSIYNKNKDNENKISKEGECGKILEYFLENKNFEIMDYLKKNLGFGELLNKADLIVDENLNKLHSYILNIIKEGKVKPIGKNKSKKKGKNKINDSEDDDEKEKKVDNDEDEEEEEEDSDEEEDEELSEEAKRIRSLEID